MNPRLKPGIGHPPYFEEQPSFWVKAKLWDLCQSVPHAQQIISPFHATNNNNIKRERPSTSPSLTPNPGEHRQINALCFFFFFLQTEEATRPPVKNPPRRTGKLQIPRRRRTTLPLMTHYESTRLPTNNTRLLRPPLSTATRRPLQCTGPPAPRTGTARATPTRYKIFEKFDPFSYTILKS